MSEGYISPEIFDMTEGAAVRETEPAEVMEKTFVALATREYETGHHEIGRGKSGVIWFGHGPGNKDLCFKTIHTPGVETNSLSQEFDYQERALHAGVRAPRLLAHLATPADSPFGDHGLVIMERIHGQTLDQEFQSRHREERPYSVEEYQSLIAAVEEQIELLHASNLHHRDLHLGNMMRREGDGKLVVVDYGRAKLAYGSDDETSFYQAMITLKGVRKIVPLPKDESSLYSIAEEVKKLGLLPHRT